MSSLRHTVIRFGLTTERDEDVVSRQEVSVAEKGRIVLIATEFP
jgi:hypothetical protein